MFKYAHEYIWAKWNKWVNEFLGDPSPCGVDEISVIGKVAGERTRTFVPAISLGWEEHGQDRKIHPVMVRRKLSLKGQTEVPNVYIASVVYYRLTLVTCPKKTQGTLEDLLFPFLWKSQGQAIRKLPIVKIHS